MIGTEKSSLYIGVKAVLLNLSTVALRHSHTSLFLFHVISRNTHRKGGVFLNMNK